MPYVSHETLADVRRELDRFKRELGRQNGYEAAHFAGAVEMLLEEAQIETPVNDGQPDPKLG